MIHGHQVSTVRVGARTAGAHPAERRLKEAFLQMAAHLKRRPHWSLHEVASRTDRSPVYHATLGAIDACIAADAPVEDVLAFPRELEAYIRGCYADEAPRPMSVVLLEEARADADADVAQSEALASLCPAAVHRVIETGERHMERLRQVVDHARTWLLLDGTRKPRLALARTGRGEVRHPQGTSTRGI